MRPCHVTFKSSPYPYKLFLWHTFNLFLSCVCSFKLLLCVRHTNMKFSYILYLSDMYHMSWYISFSLIYAACEKQFENENHEIVQIFHAQNVTFCLQSSVINLDICMWWWEHISAPLYPLQAISTFSAKHSPDDIKRVSVQISHRFFTILLNWYRMSLVSFLLEAMNSNLYWVKGYTTFLMICISYWPNKNTFSCYVMMWLIGFIFLRKEVFLMICVCIASVAFKKHESFTGSLCLKLPWRMLFCFNNDKC